MLKVIACDDRHKDAWNAFVARDPNASFYLLYEWREINRASFGHDSAYLAAYDGDELAGILPVIRVKSRLFGDIACSLPFVNYGGVCAARADVEEALLHELQRTAARWGVEYVEIRSKRRLPVAWPHSEHKISLSVNLDPDPDVLWNAFKTGHRQEIRRAYKNGYQFKSGAEDLLDDFYEVIAESWRNLGTPIYQPTYFGRIVRAFPGHVRIGVIYAEGEPVAAAFDGLWNATVEGMWMGAKSEHRNRGVNYALYWELIKNACETGYARFHLGRSSADSGGETFKKKWNADVTPLYWIHLLCKRTTTPALAVSNPRYKLAINTWRRLPVGLTRYIGPYIARSIP